MRTSLIAAGLVASIAVAAAPVATAAPASSGAPSSATSASKVMTDVRSSVAADGTRTTSGTFDVPGLDESVVRDYNKYISLKADGHFKASIPAGLYFTDAKRAWAATNSVTKANFLIDKQRMELLRNGYTQQQIKGSEAVRSGLASKLLPMGEHATFQADWWGMTFTLDKVAADQLNNALEKTKKVEKLLAVLAAVGVVIAPEVSAIVGAILAGIAVVGAALKACTTEDGLVIKALWVPIPWCEKPAGPFVPAPPKDSTPGQPAPTDPAPSVSREMGVTSTAVRVG